MIKIRAFINGWNGRCQPFVWTKTADQILTKPTVKQLQLRSTRTRATARSSSIVHGRGTRGNEPKLVSKSKQFGATGSR
jgi:hypothetical protein